MAGDNRADRFFDGEGISVLSQSKNINELRPFYDGEMVNERMTEVRASIEYIRSHWEEYANFVKSLREMSDLDKLASSSDETIRSLAVSMINVKKKWHGIDKEESDKDEFEALRFYTSETGYRSLFWLINSVFRQDDSVHLVKRIRSAVFLVELINIDLYNYCIKNPKFDNFEGIVYRGLGLTQQDLEAFKQLPQQPINDRYISIPLSLMSSTFDRKIAEDFITAQFGKSDSQQPLLLRIHVIGLKKEYLEHYRKRFPTSVVSSICAVDIKDISFFPGEREVLLRGPFFQVLRLYSDVICGGMKCHVLDMVMLNSNRDHPSSVMLGEDSQLARKMFGTMVGVTRCEFAYKYCKDHGLEKDMKEYKRMYEEKKAALEELMSS